MTPEQLIRACAAGDDDAWRSFVSQYGPWIQSAARRFAPSEAEDVASEVFRQLVQNERAMLRGLQPPYNLRAWLAVVARRTAGKFLRKRTEAPGVVEEAVADRTAPAGIEDLLDDLDALDRLILKLFYVDDAPYEEIAEITGVPVNTLGKRKFRALQQLREAAARKRFLPKSGG